MQSKFARDMMAQKLMSENKDNPFNSRFFQPSDAMAAPTRQGFSNLLSRMEQKDKQGTDVFPALAIGSGFAPSAGISDVLGFAPDPFNPGQTLPSFSENIDRGNYLDAGLQTLGAGGDVMLAAAPFAPLLLAPAAAMKATSQIGKALRSGSKVTETSKLFESVKKFPALSKSEETLVASSSAPVNEIAGLGRVKIEKIDPNDLEGSKKRFDELKALTSGYKQERAKAKIIRLENGENAIQYMQPPTEVKKLNISELIATQDNVVLGTNKTAGDVMPLVVKKDGKFFIRDGHHRIAQNINSGDKTADVRLIDLDKGGFVGVKATKSTDNSILQQLKTLRSDLKNTTSQAEKVKIEEQITVLRGQREQQLNDIRKQANIERFGYDPNDPSTLPDTSYRIQHQARGPKDDTPVRLDDLTKSTTGESAGFPDDFYTPRGQSIYAQGPRFSDDQYGLANIESYNIIKSIRGKPDAEVTIYRGVPDEESIKSINPGDFVTLSKKYAELHAAGGYGDGGQEAGKIISKKVKVKDIYWDQNDVNEFGYFPESN